MSKKVMRAVYQTKNEEREGIRYEKKTRDHVGSSIVDCSDAGGLR